MKFLFAVIMTMQFAQNLPTHITHDPANALTIPTVTPTPEVIGPQYHVPVPVHAEPSPGSEIYK